MTEFDPFYDRTIQRPVDASLWPPTNSSDQHPGHRRYAGSAVGRTSAPMVEQNGRDPNTGQQQLVEWSEPQPARQDPNIQSLNPNFSAEGMAQDSPFRADRRVKDEVRGSRHSPNRDSAPMENGLT